MNLFFDVVGLTGALLVLALAAFGALCLVLLFTGQYDERMRLAEQARESERQITEIGRRAQAAILNEALRRAHGRRDGAEHS